MIDPISTIELKKSILEDNDADAEKLRAELNARGVYYINLMSAPGSSQAWKKGVQSMRSISS